MTDDLVRFGLAEHLCVGWICQIEFIFVWFGVELKNNGTFQFEHMNIYSDILILFRAFYFSSFSFWGWLDLKLKISTHFSVILSLIAMLDNVVGQNNF